MNGVNENSPQFIHSFRSLIFFSKTFVHIDNLDEWGHKETFELYIFFLLFTSFKLYFFKYVLCLLQCGVNNSKLQYKRKKMDAGYMPMTLEKVDRVMRLDAF